MTQQSETRRRLEKIRHEVEELPLDDHVDFLYKQLCELERVARPLAVRIYDTTSDCPRSVVELNEALRLKLEELGGE